LQTRISKISFGILEMEVKKVIYRVPPAFFKVREPVLESEFQEFKKDA